MAEGSISTSDLPLYVLDGSHGTYMFWVMMTFETMTMLVNLAMKLTVTAEIFLIDSQMPLMIKHNTGGRAVYCVVSVK